MGFGRLALLVGLLMVFAATGHLLCVDSFVIENSLESTETSEDHGGITVSLIHRDHHFADEVAGLTHREKMDRDMRMSKQRAEYIASKRRLTQTAASPSAGPGPAPGGVDWETPLFFHVAAYLMEISIGTPAQTFTTIADTGSDLTWLQCSPCQSCTRETCGACQNDVYDPSKSSTYAPLGCSATICQFLNESGSICPVSNGGNTTGCDFGYGYGDGSQITGNVAQESVSLQTVSGTTQTLPNYWFGCTHNANTNSSLLDGTDGLVGLGRGNISFPSQLGPYFGNKFGYCLVNRSVSTNISVSSPLYFGADAVPVTAQNGSQLQYTPMIDLSSSTFYYVGCTGISLGGNLISTIPASAFDIQDDGSGGIIFDSGTTYTTLSETIFKPFVAAIEQQITTYVQDKTGLSGFDLCYIASWSDWINDYGKGVPIVSFQFTNTTGFPLLVDTTWLKYDDLTVCLGFSNGGSGSGGPSIFGSYQMVNNHIVFDTGNTRIGFVKSTCTNATAVVIQSSSARIAEVGTSLVTGLLSLLLLLVLTQ